LNQLGEHLSIDDHAVAVVGADAKTVARQLLFEFLISHMLIAQTALEPSAASRYLGGIERGLLELGHPHGDRPQRFEEHFATHFATAGFIIGQKSGLVPRPHLAHFDARSIFRGKIPHQVSKIDPLFRSEVVEQPFTAEQMFALHDLER